MSPTSHQAFEGLSLQTAIGMGMVLPSSYHQGKWRKSTKSRRDRCIHRYCSSHLWEISPAFVAMSTFMARTAQMTTVTAIGNIRGEPIWAA